MALQPSDQFYLQRPNQGSKDYEKIKTTVKDIDEYISTGITTDYDNLSDRLDQEIIDRIDGDEHLSGQLEGLSDRLASIGKEIYNVTASGKFEYRISQGCKNSYTLLDNLCDDGSPDHIVAECKSNARQAYLECIASDVATDDSRGKFYLETPNFEFDQAGSIFSSTVDIDGFNVTYEDLLPGDFVEILGITVLSDGTEVVDNFNYALYEITGSEFQPATEDFIGSVESLYRFDISYLTSTGKPKVGQKYVLNYMVNMERELGKAYVQRKGDTMYGTLNVAIEGENPITATLETGINSRNSINALALNVTGTGSRGYSNLLPDMVFTSVDNVNINFLTEQTVTYNYAEDSSIVYKRGNYEYMSSHGEETLIIDGESVTNPAYVAIRDKVFFNGIAEYISFPNLLTPVYNKPETVTPKGYVDVQDAALDAKISDINNRIDTLANASDTFRYDMIIDTLITECDTAHLGVPQSTDYDDGKAWGLCVAGKIQEQAVIGAGTRLFSVQGPFTQPYTNEDGDADTRDVDIIVLDHFTHIYSDPDENIVDIDWSEFINVGDYFEISTTDLRNTAYGVWRCTNKILHTSGNVVITGVSLFKSQENIIQGYIYKFKKYDKTSGLTMDDVLDRFVNVIGDTMTGALNFEVNTYVATNIIKIHDEVDTDRVKFKVTTEGYTYAPRFALMDTEGGANDGMEDGYWIHNQLHVKPRNPNEIFTFYNETLTGFKFINGVGSGDDLLYFGNNHVNVYDKRIINVKDATQENDAVTWSWMHTNLVKRGDKQIIEYDKTNGGMKWSIDSYQLSDMTDVKWTTTPQSSWKNNLVLVWDKTKQKWKESEQPYEVFRPGNKVATTNSKDSNLQQYGFYYNTSTDQLFLKV